MGIGILRIIKKDVKNAKSSIFVLNLYIALNSKYFSSIASLFSDFKTSFSKAFSLSEYFLNSFSFNELIFCFNSLIFSLLFSSLILKPTIQHVHIHS